MTVGNSANVIRKINPCPGSLSASGEGHRALLRERPFTFRKVKEPRSRMLGSLKSCRGVSNLPVVVIRFAEDLRLPHPPRKTKWIKIR